MLQPSLPGLLLRSSSDAACGDQELALSRGWWLLALLALAASTLCAVVLVVARTPFLGLGAGFFRTALVLHVDLAVVVWFLAVAAGLWLAAVPLANSLLARLVQLGLWLAAGGVAAMLLAPFGPAAVPVLANYVPVLEAPVFYLGLAAFMTGIGLVASTGLLSLSGRRGKGNAPFADVAWRWAAAAAMAAFLAALVIFLLAAISEADPGSLESRLWGGGHALQMVHTLMLMAAWLHLGRPALQQVRLRRRGVFCLIALELAAVLADLAIAALLPPASPDYRRAFTEIMRWASWPAPIALAGYLATGYWRCARRERLAAADRAVLGSLALFALGCAVGVTIRGETTAVPAHYHGTVGAVTLAYMIWARQLLPGFGPPPRLAGLWRWQPLIYGAGIGLMVCGLAWAGSLGVPRKSPHVETVIAAGIHDVAMGLAGVGGLLATLGAGVFVLGIAIAIGKKRND